MGPAGGARRCRLRRAGAATFAAVLLAASCSAGDGAPAATGGPATASAAGDARAEVDESAQADDNEDNDADRSGRDGDDDDNDRGNNDNNTDRDDDLKPVPEVSFNYFDGSAGTLDDFTGTPTVINFWASWCPPCIVEMPAFEAVHVELAPQVAFLGINVGDELSAAKQLAERTGVGYPLAADPDSAIFGAFGGIGMPTTVLVDPDGMIVHMISSRLRARDLRALITEHLGV